MTDEEEEDDDDDDDDDDDNDVINIHEVHGSECHLSLHDRPSVIMTTWNAVHSCGIYALDGVCFASGG